MVDETGGIPAHTQVTLGVHKIGARLESEQEGDFDATPASA